VTVNVVEIMKIVPKVAWTHTLEKIDQWHRRKARTEILWWLSEQSLEVVSVFKEDNLYFMFIFSLTRQL
jgi:hypothetical protein